MNKLVKYGLLSIMILLLISFIYNNQFKNKFNKDVFSEDLVYEHIAEMSSAKYEGSLAGSLGNERLLKYIENEFVETGLKAGGENGSFYQSFETMIPIIDEEAIFEIRSDSGDLESFEMYKDYSIITDHSGGGIDFEGDMIFVDSNLLRIPKELIKDKVVVIESSSLNPKRIQYVVDNGGLGIICSADSENFGRRREYEFKKYIGLSDKTGKNIMAGFISRATYTQLLEKTVHEESDNKYLVGTIHNTRIKIDVDFPIVETSNILGVIEGSDKNARVLILSANIDGLGTGTDNNYFPGALRNVSGIATLLEVARVIQEQEISPYETIVIVGWNGQEQQLSGSNYYLENPLYPLEQTTLIHIDTIGMETLEGLKISSDYINSNIHRDKFIQFSRDNQVKLGVEFQEYSAINGFIDELVPSLMISDGNDWDRTYEDTIDNINKEYLYNGGIAVVSYLQRESYEDQRIDYLNLSEKILILILFLLITFNSMISYNYKRHPNRKVLTISIETIFYSVPVRLIRAFIKNIMPVFVIIFGIVILANISPQTNIKKINGEWVTNFSPYLVFKRAVFYIRSMFNPEAYVAYAKGDIVEVILGSSLKSLKLISSALGLSIVFGIAKGLFDGYRAKKAKMNSMGTIVIFSIPDVLVVLLGLMLYVFIARNLPELKDEYPLREFVFPLVTLMLIPTIYISRITFITSQNELDKDYIKHAKAIGMSRFKIFAKELFPSVAFTVVDTMPAIMAMLLTNMIIVEYLFNYNGIVFYLLYLYKKHDTYRFVPLALTLGLIYILFTYGVSWIAKMINPLKREVKS